MVGVGVDVDIGTGGSLLLPLLLLSFVVVVVVGGLMGLDVEPGERYSRIYILGLVFPVDLLADADTRGIGNGVYLPLGLRPRSWELLVSAAGVGLGLEAGAVLDVGLGMLSGGK